jgi:hypothetical protein
MTVKQFVNLPTGNNISSFSQSLLSAILYRTPLPFKKDPQKATINELPKMTSNSSIQGIHSGKRIPVKQSHNAEHPLLDRKERKLVVQLVKCKNCNDVKPKSVELNSTLNVLFLCYKTQNLVSLQLNCLQAVDSIPSVSVQSRSNPRLTCTDILKEIFREAQGCNYLYTRQK